MIEAAIIGIFFFCVHGSKHKTNKSISRRHGYHELAGEIYGRVLIKDYIVYEK